MIADVVDLKNRINKHPMSCTWQWCVDWMNQTISTLPAGAVVVEFGTFVGGTTRQMALANPNSIVHTIDLNDFGPNHQFMVDNFKEFYACPHLATTDLRLIQNLHLLDLPNVIRHTGDSKTLDVKNIDVAYVDAGHSYNDVFADLEHVYHNLNIGGCIFGDDIDSAVVYHAVYDFARKYDLEFTVYSKFFKIKKIAESEKIDQSKSRQLYETMAPRYTGV